MAAVETLVGPLMQHPSYDESLALAPPFKRVSGYYAQESRWSVTSTVDIVPPLPVGVIMPKPDKN